MTSSRRSHWEAVYTNKAPDEVSWFQPHAEISMELIAAVAPGARSLIDVGGGASPLAEDLLATGMVDLAVLDISEAALQASRQRLGPDADRIDWMRANITDWVPHRTWDVWHDRAVFHFLTDAADQEAYLRALHAATAPGAAVVISTFAADGPEKCSGLPVERYDAGKLARRLGPSYALTAQHAEPHRTPWGSVQNFLYAAFLKR